MPKHSHPNSTVDREQRCKCGQLLALLMSEGVEIKCKRCKRLETIPLEQLIQFIQGKGPLSPDPSRRADGLGCGCASLRKGTTP